MLADAGGQARTPEGQSMLPLRLNERCVRYSFQRTRAWPSPVHLKGLFAVTYIKGR
jgi:hypothetical protein